MAVAPNIQAPEARRQVSPPWSRAHAKAEGWVSEEKKLSPSGATQFHSGKGGCSQPTALGINGQRFQKGFAALHGSCGTAASPVRIYSYFTDRRNR